ncbi:serine/threonine-protein kinase CTR1-like [Chenopodium quinoa]|uniref:non-specific serine/threonine protein kinase n=1 Tax=Chenopodium quinoa TaxID=63459 RepID=A0A803MQM9_CHEQI|nr:serine/threonine-protein kinase CTR1-like [Chenopodium quinoa]XP_021764811.1 serine/threonine-protein kinase CTR1-like [Chenopodium quinoa]
MEMPGRRSNYTLLSQVDDHSTPATAASKYSGVRGERNMFPASIGLQRQSSGSSFGESSLSDHYVQSISLPASDLDGFSYLQEERGSRKRAAIDGGGGGGCGESSSSKSWAQQTEESYQLQLALALRLSSEAACADDPNFLDPMPDESSSRLSSSESAESISHRFWVNGCLSYSDQIPDGFYLIHGMDPYVWTVCADLQENGRIPSIESLKSVTSVNESSLEVVLIDRRSDSTLKELLNRALDIYCNCMASDEVVDQMAKLVCSRMGGAASTREEELFPIWEEFSNGLKDCLGSVVLPVGSLSIGLCKHRALLFKVLADSIDLPCRIAKGCKYCNRNDATSCLVRFGLDREYLVDLVGKPGCLCEPDSLLNGPSSISISSPLRFPRFRTVEPAIDFRSLAKQYFSDSQSLNLVFDRPSTGTVVNEQDAGDPMYLKQLARKLPDANNSLPNDQVHSQFVGHDRESQSSESNSPPQNVGRVPNANREFLPSRFVPPSRQRVTQPFTDSTRNSSNDFRFEPSQLVSSRSEAALDMDDLVISWGDLVVRDRIGAGSFGTVHRAEWNGSEVAVKILMESDFHPERCNEFLREVAIMKRLRHPNIVLFMGAVTEPPNLAIVTEYLCRGSLYRLLHKSGGREVLDERRRLSMAYDVAKGMNYLHKRNPPIVHRDLKSPNLLVDKKYTVKVCDFGLSRLKANTFLSSKSAAGTPEWMAPEVLRDEPSNEKSDVYSFGIILWELATLQQPWSSLNPAQVVAAVGFKGKRLDIPRDVNPQIAAIIEACWANEPWKRPSFANIMDSLRTILKPPAPQSVRGDAHIIT